VWVLFIIPKTYLLNNEKKLELSIMYFFALGEAATPFFAAK